MGAPQPQLTAPDQYRQAQQQRPPSSSGHPLRGGTRPNSHEGMPQTSGANNMARFSSGVPGGLSTAVGDATTAGRRGMANYPNGAGLEVGPGANPSSMLMGEGQDRLLGPQPPYPGGVGMRDPNGTLGYGVNPPSGASGDANLLGGDEMVAARLRAAAVAARRDYQYATMQLRQIEAAEKQKRAILDLGGMRPPMHDDIEVAKAMSNLGNEVHDENLLNNRYPVHGTGGMLDPLLGRFPGVGRGHDPLGLVGPHGPVPANFMPTHLGAHPMPLSYPSADISRQIVNRNPGMQMHDDHNNHYMQMQANQGVKRKSGSPNTNLMIPHPTGPGYGTVVAPPKAPQENPKKGKRPTDMPRRPLSAYNFFFSEERERVLESLPSPNASGVEDNESSDNKPSTTDDADKNKDSKDKEKASSDDTGGSDKEPPPKKQSNTERLLSLRMVQNNVRRPHRKTHGKIGFKALAKLIGERWRALPTEKREYYRKLADTDLSRYKDQMKEYHRKNKWSFIQQQEQAQQANPNPPSNNGDTNPPS